MCLVGFEIWSEWHLFSILAGGPWPICEGLECPGNGCLPWCHTTYSGRAWRRSAMERPRQFNNLLPTWSQIPYGPRCIPASSQRRTICWAWEDCSTCQTSFVDDGWWNFSILQRKNSLKVVAVILRLCVSFIFTFCAEIILGTIELCLHFLPFLNPEMAQIV